MQKIVSKDIFHREIRKILKEQNKTIVLCHGVFDLVHPGHIIHLKQAKEMGDVLAVSITAAKYVRKGPGRPYFNDDMRMKFLEALECVDYVLLSESETVHDIIQAVRPDIYVKGKEYENPEDDLTGKIAEEKAFVEKHGGKVCFTAGQTFSSTKLINTAMDGLTDEIRDYIVDFKTRYSILDIKRFADRIAEMRILVIGDIIIDKYTYCDIQGLMTKDIGYSARMCSSEEYMGGAAAVARHLSSFTPNITLMSMIGNEKQMADWFNSELGGSMKLALLPSNNYPTLIKHRYLSRDKKREEYHKIFAVNNIPENASYGETDVLNYQKMLEKEIQGYDAVFLCDFGHGLINQDVMDIVQNKARYLILNCQTNSSNHGLNIITKYKRADIFSLDQQELRLAFPVYASREKQSLKKLSEHLKGKGWLTRGSQGAYGLEKNFIYECPAFTLNVKDTVGAGDAFFAVAGAFTAAGASIELGTFIGNVAGALGANIVGNKKAVEKVNVLKYADTLMNI